MADGVTVLAYAAMRRAWCRRALAQLARRWGVYAVVVMVLTGAGISGGVEIVRAVAAGSVLPLFHAVAKSWPGGLAAIAVQAATSAGIVWALRPLLLPQRWLEAERALPIGVREQRRSDTALTAIALLPLFVLHAAGSASLLAAGPAWLQPRRAAALFALVLADASSVALGVALLQARRRPPRYRVASAQRTARTGWCHWPAVLLGLPLWRGPARRLGALLAGGAVLLCVPLAGLALWPPGGGWWLAALAAAGLVVATRAATLVADDIAPLLATAVMLPLPPQRLRRGAALLPLAPLLPAYAVLPWLLPPARPSVLLAFISASFGAAAMQALWTPADDETRAGRWLLSLAVLLALASEVLT